MTFRWSPHQRNAVVKDLTLTAARGHATNVVAGLRWAFHQSVDSRIAARPINLSSHRVRLR